jgi:chromosome segregation ATPase
MNQFDALMTQIGDLEGVNRDAERQILALSQHKNALDSENSSLKSSIREREEEYSLLHEKIGILTEERDIEAKNVQRLKAKYKELKAADATRAKALDEDRQSLAKAKLCLEQQIQENNAKLRSALASFCEHLRKHSIEPSNTLNEDAPPSNRPQTPPQIQNSDSAAELQQRLQVAEEKITTALGEKTKLEQNLTTTLLEFEKLDEFARSLQSRYEAIQTWYETLETWNQSGKCPSCDCSIDILSIVDKLLEEKTSNASPQAPASES